MARPAPSSSGNLPGAAPDAEQHAAAADPAGAPRIADPATEAAAAGAASGEPDGSEPPRPEIAADFGFLPDVLRASGAESQAVERLLKPASGGSLDNPLPPLLREQISTYLARCCPSASCAARHVARLLAWTGAGQGRSTSGSDAGDEPSASDGSFSAEDVRALLSQPFPTEAESAVLWSAMQRESGPLAQWPVFHAPQGGWFQAACLQIFRRPFDSHRWQDELRRLLGAARYEQLMALLAVVRLGHFWTGVHPEVEPDDDVRALLAECPEFPHRLAAAVSPAELGSPADGDGPRDPRAQYERTAAALRASEGFARRVIEHLYTFVGVMDLDGNLMESNRAPLQATGLPASEVYGRPLWETWTWNHSAEEQRRHQAAFERAKAGEVVRYLARARMAGGRFAWLDMQMAPLLDAQGRVTHVIPSAMDVTRQRETEEHLRASEARLRLAIDGSNGAEWQASLDASSPWGMAPFVRIERRQKQFIGFDDEEFPDRVDAWLARLHPDDVASLRAEIAAHLAGTTPFCRGEYRVRHRDGSWRWILGVARTYRDPQSGEVRLAGVNWDVTDRKSAEEQLREADRRKDVFLATLAHELRNPLAPMRSAVEILRLAPGDPAARESAREVIDRQLHHMVRLTDDLLDVNRISLKKLVLHRERSALGAIIESSLESARPHLEAGRHRLTLSLPDEPLLLDVDPVRIAQVFFNLLHNAAKYTDPGGEIRLVAARDGTSVVVDVTDNGIGIEPSFQPDLFKLFAQSARGAEHSQGGLGIGLPLVQGIVTLHGGTIAGRSAGIGRGSTFTVRLPLASDAVAPAPPPPARCPQPVRPLRVVVADDNRDAADSLALVLAIRGHEVRTARDGREAVQAVAEFQPHLALIDLGMPGINGYEAAESIRREPWGRRVKLVAVTGWGRPADRRRYQAAGFDAHAVKPLEQRVLAELLASIAAD